MDATLLQLPDVASSLNSSAAPLQTEVQPIDDAFHARASRSLDDWYQLYRSDPHAVVRQHPELVLSELAYEIRAAEFPPYLVTCRQDQTVLGAAILVPRHIPRSHHRSPGWALSGYRLAGNRLLGSQQPEIMSSLMQACAALLQRTTARFLLVEDLDSTDSLLQLIEQPGHDWQAFRPSEFQLRHRIQLPDSLDAYWQGFNAKSRSTLKRKLKKFGDCRLQRITRPDQVPEFLEAARQVSARSWQHRMLGPRIRNDEAELQNLTRLAIEGALRAYLLWRKEEAVSFCLGTQSNGVFHYEEVGYDGHLGHLSPGVCLLMLMLEDLFQRDRPQLVDFGGGHADYKQRFANLQSTSGNVWLLPRGLHSRLIVVSLSGRRVLGQTARRLARRLGVYSAVRRLTRRTT